MTGACFCNAVLAAEPTHQIATPKTSLIRSVSLPDLPVVGDWWGLLQQPCLWLIGFAGRHCQGCWQQALGTGRAGVRGGQCVRGTIALSVAASQWHPEHHMGVGYKAHALQGYAAA